MTALLGPITATFSIRSDALSPVEDDVRAILGSRYLEPRRVRSRQLAGTTVVIVEQPGTNEAEAMAILSEVRALDAVQSAELECRLERLSPRPKAPFQFEPQRIDVV